MRNASMHHKSLLTFSHANKLNLYLVFGDRHRVVYDNVQTTLLSGLSVMTVLVSWFMCFVFVVLKPVRAMTLSSHSHSS